MSGMAAELAKPAAARYIILMIEQIKKRLDEGFSPFALRLSDGRSFAVPHRDFIAISSKTIVVIDRDELAVSINPLHVVSVDDTRPATPSETK